MDSKSGSLAGVAIVAVAVVLGLVVVVGLYQWEGASRLAASEETQVGGSQGIAVSRTLTAEPLSTATPSSPGPAATSTPVVSAQGDPVAGEATFNSLCGACHPNGRAGVGPDLRGLPEERIVRVTRQGRGGMPAFKEDRLSAKQMADIVAYLVTLH